MDQTSSRESAGVEAEARDEAEQVLDEARGVAEEFDRPISTEIKFGHPTRNILNRADEFDLVVVGSHGGSLADRLFVGNIAEAVFRRSPTPVTVVR